MGYIARKFIDHFGGHLRTATTFAVGVAVGLSINAVSADAAGEDAGGGTHAQPVPAFTATGPESPTAANPLNRCEGFAPSPVTGATARTNSSVTYALTAHYGWKAIAATGDHMADISYVNLTTKETKFSQLVTVSGTPATDQYGGFAVRQIYVCYGPGKNPADPHYTAEVYNQGNLGSGLELYVDNRVNFVKVLGYHTPPKTTTTSSSVVTAQTTTTIAPPCRPGNC